MLQYLQLFLLMTKTIYILFFSLVCASDFESAFVLKESHRSNALFQHRRYGMKNNIELAVHSLTFPLIPNIMIKKQHFFDSPIAMASRITMYSPTPLLKLLQKQGIGGLLSDELDIGDVPISFINRYEVLFSIPLDIIQLTLKQGFTLGLNQSMDQRLSIDLPFIVNRLSPMHQHYGFNMGADIRYQLSSTIDVLTDIDMYFYHDTYIEHKLLLQIEAIQKIDFYIGYKSFFGPYYIGDSNKFRIIPVVDVSWNWQKK